MSQNILSVVKPCFLVPSLGRQRRVDNGESTSSRAMPCPLFLEHSESVCRVPLTRTTCGAQSTFVHIKDCTNLLFIQQFSSTQGRTTASNTATISLNRLNVSAAANTECVARLWLVVRAKKEKGYRGAYSVCTPYSVSDAQNRLSALPHRVTTKFHVLRFSCSVPVWAQG